MHTHTRTQNSIVRDNSNDWFTGPLAACVDTNPNSNGTVSKTKVVSSMEFSVSNFLVSKPVPEKPKGTVYTRNLKKFNNCVNACRTKEHESILSRALDTAHREIIAADASRNKSAAKAKSADTGINDGTKRSIATLNAVEHAATYSRKKPLMSPSKH